MATRTATKPTSEVIDIAPVKNRSVEICVLGATPIILNRMSNKVRQELLLPKGRKTDADRAATLKHDPLAEYRDSPYTTDDEHAPTLLEFLPSAFKQAMETASSDIPASVTAKIRRNVWITGERVPLYGIPELMMSPVRSADMNRTPDIHTRAIIRDWACSLTVQFSIPLLNERSVINLLAAAGQICGVGDWRPEKGSGTYGQFVLVSPNDKRYLDVIATGGRQAQIEAMANPIAYDKDTAELFGWFSTEVLARGKTATTVSNGAVAEDALAEMALA